MRTLALGTIIASAAFAQSLRFDVIHLDYRSTRQLFLSFCAGFILYILAGVQQKNVAASRHPMICAVTTATMSMFTLYGLMPLLRGSLWAGLPYALGAGLGMAVSVKFFMRRPQVDAVVATVPQVFYKGAMATAKLEDGTYECRPVNFNLRLIIGRGATSVEAFNAAQTMAETAVLDELSQSVLRPDTLRRA